MLSNSLTSESCGIFRRSVDSRLIFLTVLVLVSRLFGRAVRLGSSRFEFPPVLESKFLSCVDDETKPSFWICLFWTLRGVAHKQDSNITVLETKRTVDNRSLVIFIAYNDLFGFVNNGFFVGFVLRSDDF